jgi:hypothetical protein
MMDLPEDQEAVLVTVAMAWHMRVAQEPQVKDTLEEPDIHRVVVRHSDTTPEVVVVQAQWAQMLYQPVPETVAWVFKAVSQVLQYIMLVAEADLHSYPVRELHQVLAV